MEKKMTRQERLEMFRGLSKREAMAVAEEHGYTVRYYEETSHGIPVTMLIKADRYVLGLYFDKATRRIRECR
jgi:acetoacetate decarboxylase